MLVDITDKECIDMGKGHTDDQGEWKFQMPDKAIIKFIMSRKPWSNVTVADDDFYFDAKEIDSWTNYQPNSDNK